MDIYVEGFECVFIYLTQCDGIYLAVVARRFLQLRCLLLILDLRRLHLLIVII